MGTFYNNLDIINDGVESLIKERHYYNNMKDIVKNTTSTNSNFKKDYLYKVKDYVYYYANDWTDGNPLVPMKNVRWRCRLASPFRSMFKAIVALRECNRLELLNPIIAALEDNGIHLSVDSNPDAQTLDDSINAMKQLQSHICELADERRDARDDAAERRTLTKAGYNNTTRSLLKIELEKTKVNGDLEVAIGRVGEKLRDLIIDSSLDTDIYAEADSYIENPDQEQIEE